MGTPPQEITLIFDTGSDWMTIESHTCGNCNGENFDYEASETFEFTGNGKSVREYGSATLKGMEAKDRVCLINQPSTNEYKVCLPKFEWFLISH